MEYPNPNSPAARTARLNALRETCDQTLDIIIAARECRNQICLRLERLGYYLGGGPPYQGVLTPEMRAMIANAAVQQQRYMQHDRLLTRQNRELEAAEEKEAYLVAEEKIEEERQRFGREEAMRMKLWRKVTEKSLAQRQEERRARKIVEMEAEILRKEAEIAETAERVKREKEEREREGKEMEQAEIEMNEVEEAATIIAERKQERMEEMARVIEQKEAELETKEAQARKERKRAKKAAKHERKNAEKQQREGAADAAAESEEAAMEGARVGEGGSSSWTTKKRKRNEVTELLEMEESEESEEWETEQIADMPNRKNVMTKKVDKGKGKEKQLD